MSEKPVHSIQIGYTNWRGEATTPTIVPQRIFWGSNEYHPEPCWLIEAVDVEKDALRTYDLSKVGGRPVDRQGDRAVPAPAGLVEAAQAYQKAVKSYRLWCDNPWTEPREDGYELKRAVERAAETLQASALGAPTPPTPGGRVEVVRAYFQEVDAWVAGKGSDHLDRADVLRSRIDAALSAQAGAAPGVGELRPGLERAYALLADVQISSRVASDIGAYARAQCRQAIQDEITRLASQPGGGPVAAGEEDALHKAAQNMIDAYDCGPSAPDSQALDKAAEHLRSAIDGQAKAQPAPAGNGHPNLEFTIAQLRHLYSHLKNGTFSDAKALADGLLSPQIAALERIVQEPKGGDAK